VSGLGPGDTGVSCVPLTARVEVIVEVGLRATSGVGVSVAACGVVPNGVSGTTPGADVPVSARDVPVAKICTSVILPGVAVPNKLSELIGVLVTLGGCEYGWFMRNDD
jgi:hypothetical protein